MAKPARATTTRLVKLRIVVEKLKRVLLRIEKRVVGAAKNVFVVVRELRFSLAVTSFFISPQQTL